MTFADLDMAASRAAAAFVAGGVRPGDRVAMWAPNSAAWVVASFGIYRAGGVLVPLNTRYKADEAAHVLRTSGAEVVVTVTDFLGSDFVGMLSALPLRERIILSGPAPDGTVGWEELLSSASADLSVPAPGA